MMSFVKRYSKQHNACAIPCSYVLCITEALCKLCYAFVTNCSTAFTSISKSHAQFAKEQITLLLLSLYATITQSTNAKSNSWKLNSNYYYNSGMKFRNSQRLCVLTQLVKLATTPFSNVMHELRIMSIISTESNVLVRRAVQNKMKQLIMLSFSNCNNNNVSESKTYVNTVKVMPADMRFVSLLFLTAMSEDNKAQYTELKTNVITPIVHQYVAFHVANNNNKINLSLAIESALPFIVFFFSYHPYYYYGCYPQVGYNYNNKSIDDESSQDVNLIALQRVFFLYLEEVLNTSVNVTHTALQLRELLVRMKISTLYSFFNTCAANDNHKNNNNISNNSNKDDCSNVNNLS